MRKKHFSKLERKAALERPREWEWDLKEMENCLHASRAAAFFSLTCCSIPDSEMCQLYFSCYVGWLVEVESISRIIKSKNIVWPISTKPALHFVQISNAIQIFKIVSFQSFKYTTDCSKFGKKFIPLFFRFTSIKTNSSSLHHQVSLRSGQLPPRPMDFPHCNYRSQRRAETFEIRARSSG